MRSRVVVTTAITLGLALGTATTAHAGNTRVIVAGPEADPIANRVHKELSSMGFEPVRVDDAAACSRGAIAAWIAEMHASGAACSDGTAVTVWVSSRSGLRIADTVAPSATDTDSGPELVAVRAAEVARASLEISASEPDPEPPPARPPVWTSSPPSAAVDAAEKLPRAPAPLPRTPTLAVATGIGALMGADATVPGLAMELDFRVAPSLALAVRADLPLQSTGIATSHATFKIAPAVFGAGVLVPLLPPESFIVPRLGAGAGVVWLRSESIDEPAPLVIPRGSTSPSFSSSSSGASGRDDIFSPLIYANAALSMRVAGPVRLVVDGLLGTTAYRMVVRDAGTHVAYWGVPFGTLAMRAEVVLR